MPHISKYTSFDTIIEFDCDGLHWLARPSISIDDLDMIKSFQITLANSEKFKKTSTLHSWELIDTSINMLPDFNIEEKCSHYRYKPAAIAWLLVYEQFLLPLTERTD